MNRLPTPGRLRRNWRNSPFARFTGAALVAAALIGHAGAALAQKPGAADKAKPRLTKAPRLTKFVEAPYPESEKAAGRAASVVLTLSLSATGTVDDVVVAESAGAAFDAAAIAAARRFVFEPAEIDDKPAGVRINYRYDFVLKVEARKTGELAGVIRDRKTGKPLPGVTVELGSGQKVVTDASGAFLFEDVPPGKQAVTLSGPSMTTIRTEETFEAAKRLTAKYDLDVKDPNAKAADDGDDFEVVVVAPPLQKQVVSTEVSADQGRRIPGTQGDVLKVVESMPGVGRSAVGSGALVVWGAAPQDTRVYVDGVRIPLLYHNGGVRSVVHSDLVKGVELSPGGYGASYGRGLGGLVTVALRPLEGDGVHGSAAVDLLDASAMVRAPLTDKLRFALAGRRSHLDSVLSRATSKDVGDFVPIPRYEDAQARLAYELGPNEALELGGLYSRDRIDRTVTAADPADEKRESRAIGFSRLYLRYAAQREDGSSVSIVPSIGTEQSRLTSRFGPTPTDLDIDATAYALRATYRGRVASFLVMTVGADTELVTSTLRRAGSISSPPREGDVRVFGQAPSDQINQDEWTTAIGSLAPYAEADFALASDTLHVVPGLRLDPYLVTGSRRTPAAGDTPAIGFTTAAAPLEPRLSVRWSPDPAVTVKAAYGVYHQAPLAEDLSAVYGNPLLGLSRATHWLLGSNVRIGETVSAEVTVFRSSSTELPIRSPSSSPLLAQALVGEGRGRAYGGQVLLRKDLTSGFFGWVSYSLIRSERTDRPGGAYRLFDYDQTHVLTALASYDLGKGFEVGARGRYTTGFPRTPVVGAYYDARRDTYDPLFGKHNSIRIPAFYQLDVRLAKRFALGWGELEAYLDVQNVTDHRNPEEIVYSYDYSQKRYITGLPVLPVAGAKLSW